MIHLKPVAAQDADQLFPLIYHTGVTETLLWDGPESLENYRHALAQRAEEVARAEKHMFTIVEDETGALIGSASIRPSLSLYRGDFGLWVGKPYQGRGYGTEVVAQLVHYGFETLKMEKIEATVFVGNWASRRAMEKNSFLLEGTIRKAVRKGTQMYDEWLFGLTRQEAGQPLEKVSQYLVHLVDRADWQRAAQAGVYLPGSLSQEGFIHFSRPEQVAGVVQRFYRGKTGLLLLWIDPAQLQAELRWEAADGQVFPHLYGPLNLEAVVFAQEYS